MSGIKVTGGTRRHQTLCSWDSGLPFLRASFGNIQIVQSLEIRLCSWRDEVVWVMETKALASCPRVKMGRRYSAPLMKLTDSTTRII